MRAGRDIALVGAAFALCPVAAALAPGDPGGPLARAAELVALERGLGLYVEPYVRAWFADRPALLAIAGFVYLWAHVPATVGALVWARLEHPRAFPLARDAFLVTQLVVVAGYLLAPTAPPRMLEAFGGARPDGGLVAQLQSPYAAMPSGHVAFAVVAAGIVCSLAPWRWVRAAAPAYPAAVTAIVIGTANHFWVDALAGAGAAASGLALAVMARTFTGAVENRRARSSRTGHEHVGPGTSPPCGRPQPATPT